LNLRARQPVETLQTRFARDTLIDMSDLRELYQEVILDHNRRPRNFRKLECADRSCEGFNPLCGDRLTVFLDMDGERIREVTFEGTGCAISRASASLMTDALEGKTIAEAEALFERFHQLVTSDPNAPADTTGLGKLAVFAGVREYPSRIKCATLSWHTLRAAVVTGEERVSTE
jgi:nitrogen fixation protein NifU and related proteins